MSTRATIRFATREDGVSFSEHPKKWHAQFYRHSDGYPEGLGVDLAESIVKNWHIDHVEIEHVDVVHGDIEYMYYIWQDHGKDIWISIFEVNYANDDCECCGMVRYRKDDSKCIFVGEPHKLIEKYKINTNDDG